MLSNKGLMTFFCLQGHASDFPLELNCTGQSQRGKSISTIQLVSVFITHSELLCFWKVFMMEDSDSCLRSYYLLSDRGEETTGDNTRQFLEFKQLNI